MPTGLARPAPGTLARLRTAACAQKFKLAPDAELVLIAVSGAERKPLGAFDRPASTVRLWGEIRGVDARTHYFELVLAAALLPAVADGSAAGALACLFRPKCAAGLRPVCAL